MAVKNGVKALAITAVSYALLVGAAFLFVMSQPDSRPDVPCPGWCMTPRLGATLVMYVIGLPAFLISLLLSAIVLVVGNSKPRNPNRVGTLASVPPAILICLFLLGLTIDFGPRPRTDPPPRPQVTQCIPISGGRGCPGG